MLVLDTDVCVDLDRGFEPVAQRVARLQEDDRLAVTAVTVHELVQGAYGSRAPKKEVAYLEGLPSALDVIDFDGAAGWIAARIAADLSTKGRPIGDLDTMVAACVIAHGGRLVTRDQKHFSQVRGREIHVLE